MTITINYNGFFSNLPVTDPNKLLFELMSDELNLGTYSRISTLLDQVEIENLSNDQTNPAINIAFAIISLRLSGYGKTKLAARALVKINPNYKILKSLSAHGLASASLRVDNNDALNIVRGYITKSYANSMKKNNIPVSIDTDILIRKIIQQFHKSTT
ncbi:MAG: hypothetical protein S4CHLAM20_09930 [Chlamydiia bacterium]|nr:hypothetical protein [Chlamydiia bacterium]